MNILFTSVGNLAFPTVQESLKVPGFSCKLIGTDIDPSAHGFSFCDKSYVVHLRHHYEYIKQIQVICKMENIDTIWPLSTEDQNYYSYYKSMIKDWGVNVICSSKNAVNIANDKYNLYSHLKDNELPRPSFFSFRSDSKTQCIIDILNKQKMPFVVKPRKGKGGKNTYIVSDDELLVKIDDRQFIINHRECMIKILSCISPELMIICEYLPGDEFSVDTLSKNGKFYYGVVRQRFKSTGGLALEAEVVNNPGVLKLAKSVVESIGLSYINNVQIKKDKDGAAKVMEINPRIPGTLSLSIKAGADFVFDTIKLLNGESIKKPEIKYGLRIKRYWAGVYTNERDRKLIENTSEAIQ